MSREGALGPLTTQFIPPPSCATYALAGPNAYLGQRCGSGGIVDDSDCWPAATRSLVPPFGGGGFYSPGYKCPVGYTPACTAVPSTATLPDYAVSFDFQFPLLADETAIGCCPSGFTCTATPTATGAGAGFQQTCVSSAPQTLTAATCDGMSYAPALTTSLPYTSMATDASGSSSDVVFNYVTYKAPLFQLNYQSLPPTAAQSQFPGATASNGPADSSMDSTDDSGLSGGAIAGIVVGVILGVLAVMAVAAFLLIRRRRQQRNAYNPGNDAPPQGWTRDAQVPLQSRDGVSHGGSPEYYELPATNGFAELAVDDKPSEIGVNEKSPAYQGR